MASEKNIGQEQAFNWYHPARVLRIYMEKHHPGGKIRTHGNRA